MDSNVYCIDCEYNLHGSVGRACPECGRGFDPSDPTTFLSAQSPTVLRILHHRKLSMGAAVVFWLYPPVMLSMFYLTWGVAWLSLGYRPQPWIDDPKYISIPVDVCYFVTGVLLIFLPPAGLAGCLATAWAGIARRKAIWETILFVVLFFAMMVGTIAVLRWDPIRVGDWFMD